MARVFAQLVRIGISGAAENRNTDTPYIAEFHASGCEIEQILGCDGTTYSPTSPNDEM